MAAFKVTSSVYIERLGISMSNLIVATDNQITCVKLQDGSFRLSGMTYRFASEQIYNEDCCCNDTVELCCGRTLDCGGQCVTVQQSEFTQDPITLFNAKIRQQYESTENI